MMGFTLLGMGQILILAARWTVLLSLISFIGGGVVGLLLLACRLAGRKKITALIDVYVEIFQGTPLLLQLFLVFFGLPLLGVDVSAWLAASVTLTLYTSAYLLDIWGGCVASISRGQWNSGASLGMTYPQQLRYVVLPQALRIAIAPTVGFMVQVVKSTALASIIGMVELTKTGNMLSNSTFRPFPIYGMVAMLYFFICFPLTWYARKLEKRHQQSIR